MSDIVSDLVSIRDYFTAYHDKDRVAIVDRGIQTIEWLREHQRAPKGSGTKPTGRPPSEAEGRLEGILRGEPDEWRTVRQVQSLLIEKHAWKQNYHQVQANISLLLGRGILAVADPHEAALRYKVA